MAFCELNTGSPCIVRVSPSSSMHYGDVTMGAIASQITSLTIVYSNLLFRRRSKKTSKFRVTGLCVGNSPGPVNSPHKGPVPRKMFPFDDVIMLSPVRCQAIIGTIDCLLSIGHLENSITSKQFSFKKIALKMSSANGHTSCLGPDV